MFVVPFRRRSISFTFHISCSIIFWWSRIQIIIFLTPFEYKKIPTTACSLKLSLWQSPHTTLSYRIEVYTHICLNGSTSGFGYSIVISIILTDLIEIRFSFIFFRFFLLHHDVFHIETLSAQTYSLANGQFHSFRLQISEQRQRESSNNPAIFLFFVLLALCEYTFLFHYVLGYLQKPKSAVDICYS